MQFLQLVCLMVTVLPASQAASKGQQCVWCNSDSIPCDKNYRTRHCSEKCATFVMLGKGDKPDYSNPFITKGCSTDGYVKKFGCDNQCYDRKYRVGSDKYFVCVYCCTGDMCNKADIPGINAGLKLNGGIFTTLITAVSSSTLGHFRLL